MKNRLFILLCCAGLYWSAAPAAAGVYMNYDYEEAADGTLTTPVSFAVVDTYDTDRPGWTYLGNGRIVNGSESGLYAAPALTDITNFLTIPEKDLLPTSVTVDFGGAAYNYLGLYWGSIDAYNEIQFLAAEGNVVSSWTGTAVISPSAANGNQTAPSTNLYVNFYDVPEFTGVKFISYGDSGGSSPFAFELDNLAVAVVPVPATIVLGLLGLGVGGWKLRKAI